MPTPFDWADGPDAEVTEPSTARKLLGFDSEDPPPAGWFNWLFQHLADLSRRPSYFETTEAMIDALAVGEVGVLYESGGWPGTALDTLAGTDPIMDADGEAVLVMTATAAVRYSRTDLSTVLATCTHSNAGTPEDAVTDGANVVVGYGNYIELFNAQTGAALFSYNHGADVNAVAMGVMNGTKYAFLAGALGTGTKYVRAIRFSDGVEAWSYNHGAEVYDIACDGRRVFIVGAAGGGANTVRCLEANNGSVIWSAAPAVYTNSKIVTDGHRVFVNAGANDTTLTVYPVDSGTALATKAFNAATDEIRYLAVDHEYLYVGEYTSTPALALQIVDKETLTIVGPYGGLAVVAAATEIASVSVDPGAIYTSLKRYARPGRPSLFARIDPATHEFNPYGWLAIPTAR